MTTVDHLIAILSRCRLLVEKEVDTQNAIAAELARAGVEHRREVRLTTSDRIDFMVGSTGVEVKVGGAKRAILRQLERYADSDAVETLVLVTNVALGLPSQLNGKPVHLVSIGRGWL